MDKKARKKSRKSKHPFSETIVKMAKRLRIDLNTFGDFDDFREETWKSPLPEFIRMLYERRFGRKPVKKERAKETD